MGSAAAAERKGRRWRFERRPLIFVSVCARFSCALARAPCRSGVQPDCGFPRCDEGLSGRPDANRRPRAPIPEGINLAGCPSMAQTTSETAKDASMDANGKVAVITGAGSGIGRATALALGGAGATIVVADVDESGGRETARLVEAADGKAAVIHIDVTQREDLERMLAFAEETFGGVDILHNNAGIATPPPRFPEAPQESWERTLFIDLWSVIAGTQAAVPALKRRGGGVIIN